MTHRLSKVVTCPPEGSLDLALSVLAVAYASRNQRVLYTRGLKAVESMLSGALAATIQQDDVAPRDLVGISDATWGINCEAPFTSDDVYGVVLTRCGGKVTATTHDLGLVVDSSSFAEAIGTSKTGEIVEHGRAIETGLGVPPRQPTYVFTDNRANALVGSGAGTLRSRHAIRRYVSFLQRVETGTCKLRFLPDSENPADCLTKAVPHAKFLSSLTWMQGEAPR